MLSKACSQHAQAVAAAAEHLQPPPSSQNTSSYRTPIYKIDSAKVLKPASASELNVRRQPAYQQPLKQGVKRCSRGLEKLPNGSFEVNSTGHSRIEVKGSSSGDPIEVIDLDENDWGSDIELDVEPPRSAISYPSLPSVSTAAATKPTGLPKAVVYPTLPRQQQVQTSYHDFDMPPPSSATVPWSSSPAQHLQPKSATYDFNAPNQTMKQEPVSSTAGKRRILPWDDDKIIALSKKTISDKSFATPAAKLTVKKKSADLWESTASAVKEQQKKHREEVRKTVKKTEATEESLLSAQVKKKKRVARVFLSEEQQHVLDLVVEQRQSVFFTGSAGTGKSVLLREIIAALRKKYSKEPDRIAVTASTGLAACNVGGVTLHSFAGIGLGKEPLPELVKKIKRNQRTKHRWLRTKVLIVDEVSMVDGELFDKLEAIARQLRNNGRPFGGIQLVITGDFFQLPPVPERGQVAKFAFDAATWSTAIAHVIGLHQVFRQKDPVFAGMLNEMREGRLSAASIKAFKDLDRELNFEDEIDATELFPLRHEVELANTQRLAKLQGQTYVFEARDGGSIQDKVQRDRILANCIAPETITLKKGAQVMLIKNIDESLVNGSIGTVIAFMDETQFDRYTIDEELQTQQDDETSITKADAESKEDKARRRLLDNLTASSRVFPLVRFNNSDGTTRTLLCQPESWKVELPSGEVQASRSQVPLILSWALSIHKAQGQTLERVKVNCGRIFEKGQAYVALSRATSMAGLQVLNFDPSNVQAHGKVVNFYANLARVELQSSKAPRTKEQLTEKNLTEYERQFLAGNTNV